MRTPGESLALLHSFAILKDNKICTNRALPQAFLLFIPPARKHDAHHKLLEIHEAWPFAFNSE
jgi:hypothetical protein